MHRVCRKTAIAECMKVVHYGYNHNEVLLILNLFSSSSCHNRGRKFLENLTFAGKPFECFEIFYHI